MAWNMAFQIPDTGTMWPDYKGSVGWMSDRMWCNQHSFLNRPMINFHRMAKSKVNNLLIVDNVGLKEPTR